MHSSALTYDIEIAVLDPSHAWDAVELLSDLAGIDIVEDPERNPDGGLIHYTFHARDRTAADAHAEMTARRLTRDDIPADVNDVCKHS